MQNIIYWFRNDLRLHDNESLVKATQLGEVVCVYVFDERQFAETSLGFKKTGALRTKFLIESVADLRENLRKLGSDADPIRRFVFVVSLDLVGGEKRRIRI